MTPRDWQAACPSCLLGLDALRNSPRHGKLQIIAVLFALRRHFIAEHYERIPPYAGDCKNCAEWRATLDVQPGQDVTRAADIRALLAVEALNHRAEHLVDGWELDAPDDPAPLPASITCPACDKTSYSPDDIENNYCGACHLTHGQLVIDEPPF